MKQVRVTFMAVVAGAVLLLFGGGIYVAARFTFWVAGAPRPGDMPAIVSYFVSAVNGVLAANLGALLGISVSSSGWRGPETATELLQWIAAGWYVVVMLAATVFWGMADFTNDTSKVVPLLPEMTRNLSGLSIAILAAVLGVQAAHPRPASRHAD
jgi:hypothetical protein